MDYNLAVKKGSENAGGSGKLLRLPNALDNNRSGLDGLKKGLQISGLIVSVGDQVTIDFDGQKVTTPKEVFKNAAPGEIKTFEVVKASKQEIELKLLEGTAAQTSRIIKANMIPDTDWEALLEKKREEARQAKKEKELQETKDKLEEISGKITGKDCMALEQEGFPAETLSIDGLYEAVNRIKAGNTGSQISAGAGRNAAAGNSGSGFAKRNAANLDTSGQISEADIAERLKEANLPITSQNLDQINKALVLSATIANMDDKTIRYLIQNNAEPTVENIYKAYYSGSAGYRETFAALSDQEWSDLSGQVSSVIEDSGNEVNEENLREARWLLEHKLPLTADTFSYKKALEELKTGSDRAKILGRMVDGMKDGKSPEAVSMAEKGSGDRSGILSDLGSVSREAVDYAVVNGKEITIRELVSIQRGLDSGEITAAGDQYSAAETGEAAAEYTDEYIQKESAGKSTPDSADSIRYEQIRAQRQLEEIRLKMTLEAAGRLEQKGISVETERLEKVVEELRKLEDSYYQKLLREADVPADEEALQTLKATTQSVEQLRSVPSYVLGSTLSERFTQTIPTLLSEGSKLQTELAKAGTAYETLMTVPNSEYGDSIRKAFDHMGTLLTELNIEATQQNLRAARILGYNSMEITQENIDRVKAYDQQVTGLINNLHPAVTVRMIKEGINPLNTTIDELNQQIDRMKEEQGISSEEKFSTYLYQLEKEDGITPEERKAYIGIYRLLYHVEKSDGAALGSLVKADREVTLSNLLTAVQTAAKGRLDAVVNDEFGMLTGMNRDKESIAQQLASFSGSDSQTNIKEQEQDQEEIKQQERGFQEQEQKEIRLQEQTKYLDRILRQITEGLSPERLRFLPQAAKDQAGQEQAAVQDQNAGEGQAAGQGQNAGYGQSGTGGGQVLASEGGIWEQLKDIPAEELWQQLKQLQQLQEIPELSEAERELYSAKAEQLRELCRNSEQAIRFLKDYQITDTPQSINLANHILSNGESPIVRLLKRQSGNAEESGEKSLKETDELSDKLIDKNSMNETYEALEADAEAMVEQACKTEILDSRKLAELRSISQQMTFLRRMAEKEFYQIPIETSQGITNINLTILRGTGESGKAAATLQSEQLGEVKGEFTLKDGVLKGFISCDSRTGLDRMKENAGEIGKAAQENQIVLKQMDFAQVEAGQITFGSQYKENDIYGNENPVIENQNGAAGNDTERTLYRIAKAFVQTVRLSEGKAADAQRAVS